MREPEVIQDGALLIRQGRIVEVGPSRRVENLAAARTAEEWDASGRVVMPGLVDCHTHLVCGLPWYTGSSDDAGPSAQAAMEAVHKSTVQRLVSRVGHTLAGMARHGTTTLEAKSGYGMDASGEIKILRAIARLQLKPLEIVPTFLCPRGLPPYFEGDADAYIRWICSDLLPKIKRRNLARFADFYCEDRTYSLEQCRYFLESARDLGFALKIHTGQSRRNSGVRLGVALEAISADHLNYATPGDVELLARSGTIAVMLPGRPFPQGPERFAPARELIDKGVAMALATGFGPGISTTYNMQMIVALACARMRMTPAEAICAATFNAACALACQQHTGSLEPGKAADLVVLDTGDYRDIAYHFGVNLVRTTIKAGVRIYEQGRIVIPGSRGAAG